MPPIISRCDRLAKRLLAYEASKTRLLGKLERERQLYVGLAYDNVVDQKARRTGRRANLMII